MSPALLSIVAMAALVVSGLAIMAVAALVLLSRERLAQLRYFIEMLILLGLLVGTWWLMYALIQHLHPIARAWS